MQLTTIETQEWHIALCEEIRATFDKAFFNSRQELIEGYYQVGKAIIEAKKQFDKSGIKGENLLQGLARNTGKSERMLYYAVALVEAYPEIEKLPEGKNLSMNKLITKYLTKKEPHECDFVEITIKKCKICGKKEK